MYMVKSMDVETCHIYKTVVSFYLQFKLICLKSSLGRMQSGVTLSRPVKQHLNDIFLVDL